VEGKRGELGDLEKGGEKNPAIRSAEEQPLSDSSEEANTFSCGETIRDEKRRKRSSEKKEK